MGVALRSIEEEVADAGAGDVLMFWSHIGEEDTGGDLGAGPVESGLAEVVFAEVGKAKEPEDGFGEAGEDAEPGAEGGWFDLGGPG